MPPRIHHCLCHTYPWDSRVQEYLVRQTAQHEILLQPVLQPGRREAVRLLFETPSCISSIGGIQPTLHSRSTTAFAERRALGTSLPG